MTVRSELGGAALQLSAALEAGNLLYLADDEQEAEALAAALAALVPTTSVLYLPSSDTLPGDRAPASPANIGIRVTALRRLRIVAQDDERARVALVMSGEASARVYPDPAAFDAAPPLLRIGEAVDVGAFSQTMEELGYVVDDRVDEPGEVAVRGDVIDIFPADAGIPARIDIAEGTITGIRRYDPASQRSEEPCDALEIGRANEPEGAATSIFSHLSPGRVYSSGKAEDRRRRFLRFAAEVGAPSEAVSNDAWDRAIATWTPCELAAPDATVPRFAEARSPLSALQRFATPLLESGRRLLLVGSARDLRFLRPKLVKLFKAAMTTIEQLSDLEELAPGSIACLKAPIDRGALFGECILIAAADLLGSRALLGEALDTGAAGLERSLGEIRAGDVVVHEDFGVAKVVGLEPAPDSAHGEVITLEHASGGRRLVPVQEAGRIWRYGADSDAIKLDKLDGSTWDKRRAAVDEAIAASALELLTLARQRSAIDAPRIDPDSALYERFVASFPFNETADQARSIQAVRDDLVRGRPMDRLVIGDVGYGKTEVGLRAAALAALDGYQVVVAAPTTVLVRQHLQTFQRRFTGTNIKVASLSRLSSHSEKKRIKSGLADGSINIVIGTAALMAKDVRFSKLGLVVIDEEQRFGAADKKKLRARADIHFLAMSATPIPRTLHRAMIGLQQISVIATPPARRQPIRTSLATLDDNMIRTALLRERARGGQSFVVVPRIEDLAPFSERLARLVPDLLLILAHGKLPAGAIDEAMVGFADGKGDVLLATNIIEAGLDVPRANTMIVWRAERFGLAQLHQLRGRVGRGNRRGQVILLTEGGEEAERTMKRLRTLTTYDRLGAGFEISAADLDQRGAGDPLAETQAGHMKMIGVDLYQHLFEAALKQVSGEDGELWLAEINLDAEGTLPIAWIPDPDIRLSLYVRLARAGDMTAIDALEEELVDRFGELPSDAERLIDMARIRVQARAAEISRVDAGPAGIALTPRHGRSDVFQGLGLTATGDRWLLREKSGRHGLTARVAALLEEVAARMGG